MGTLFQILAKLDHANQRELVGLIRLPLIQTASIVKEVLPSGLVDKDLCIQALAHQADASSVTLPEKEVRHREYYDEALGQSIIEYLQGEGSSHGDAGVPLAALCGRFSDFTGDEVHTCLKKLVQDGDVFTTIDEETFAAVD